MPQKEKLPVLIRHKADFSCFLGVAKGTLEATIYNPESGSTFPAKVGAKTNLGAGEAQIELSGNKTLKRTIDGVDLEVVISQWKCTEKELSFHVKATVQKGLSCTVLNTTLSGERQNTPS